MRSDLAPPRWSSWCRALAIAFSFGHRLQGDAEPESLTVVRKPRLSESHKGGKLWEEGSTLGDKCLLSWIAGTVDATACSGELKRP